MRDVELEENKDYLKSKIKNEKLVTLIFGGPNAYYDYNKSERHNRKLGHITLNNKNRDKLIQDLNTVYNFIKT